MLWQDYRLEHTILKATERLSLWRGERGSIEVSEGTLAIPINLDGQQRGYVFHGNGKLLLDTIVETEEGAIGESVDKELTGLFLMLGDTREFQPHLATAGKEDLKAVGYENEQDFVAQAEALFERFSRNRRMHLHWHGDTHGSIFAFPNETAKLDILIVKGSKMVYRSVDKVFISNENKVILKTPREVVLSNDQKSLFIRR